MNTYFRITAYDREHDMSFIIDSVNQHETLPDFIRVIIDKFSLLEGSSAQQFEDGNIPKAIPAGECYILRACIKGRARRENGVITMNNRYYTPNTGKKI